MNISGVDLKWSQRKASAGEGISIGGRMDSTRWRGGGWRRSDSIKEWRDGGCKQLLIHPSPRLKIWKNLKVCQDTLNHSGMFLSKEPVKTMMFLMVMMRMHWYTSGWVTMTLKSMWSTSSFLRHTSNRHMTQFFLSTNFIFSLEYLEKQPENVWICLCLSAYCLISTPLLYVPDSNMKWHRWCLKSRQKWWWRWRSV